MLQESDIEVGPRGSNIDIKGHGTQGMGRGYDYGRISGRSVPEQWDRGNAVQQVQGMVRTMRDTLEIIYMLRLDGHSQLIPWMVMHAAASFSMFNVGKGGTTPIRQSERQDVPT